jgi:hypothetical protein
VLFFTGAVAIFLPVFVVVLIPAFTGERLSDSGDLQLALALIATSRGPASSIRSPQSRR